MSHAPELNERYSLIIPSAAQEIITGYHETDPWLNQPNDVMRALVMGVGMARQYAISYRDFTVGAVGITLRKSLANGDHVIYALHGANDKPGPDSETNIHAEHEMLDAAETLEATLTVASLFGDNQPDQGTGVAFPAIVPCSTVCLPLLQASPAIDKERTLFTSISPARDDVLIYTLDDLKKAYAEHSTTHMYKVHLEHPLSLFDPHEATDSTLRLTETAESIARDDEFTDKISIPVLEHITRVLQL